MDHRAFQLASEISKYLMEKSKILDASPPIYDGEPPFDDFAYGAAIADWERKNKPYRAWFSTEDPHLLYYKHELSLKFGLRVVTREEATQLDLQHKAVKKIVTERTWLDNLGIINPFKDDPT